MKNSPILMLNVPEINLFAIDHPFYCSYLKIGIALLATSKSFTKDLNYSAFFFLKPSIVDSYSIYFLTVLL